MNKFLFLFLLILGLSANTTSNGVTFGQYFWNLIKPFDNADASSYYVRKVSQVAFCPVRDCPIHFASVPKFFAHDDPVSKDRQAKFTILFWYNQNLAQGAVQIGGPTLLSTVDPLKRWNDLPIRKRLWWTFKHRCPYTYFATLGKWGIELAIVAGCVKAALEVKKWYQNRKKQENQDEAQTNPEN